MSVILPLYYMVRSFLPFEICCRNYPLQTHFLQYESFVKSIRSYIVKSTVENESKEKISGPVCSVHYSLILKNKKGYIYDEFILNNVTPASLAKWQTYLDINIVSTWKRLFYLPFQISKDTDVRWFQTRINHRILWTNYLLCQMNLKANDKWAASWQNQQNGMCA